MEKEKYEDEAEVWESQDPEVDINEINRCDISNRPPTTISTNIITTETEKISTIYDNLTREEKERVVDEPFYIKTHKNYLREKNLKDETDIDNMRINRTRIPGKSVATTAVSDNAENPFYKFEKIKQEISFIEKDIEFYKNNEELFKQKFNYSFKDAFDELEKIKKVTDFISKSENLKTLKKINDKNSSLLKDKNSISLLNTKMFESENKKLLENMSLIHEIKDNKITNFENICYELYLTPDTNNIKLYTQIVEIQKSLDDIKEKIGNYDIVSFYQLFLRIQKRLL